MNWRRHFYDFPRSPDDEGGAPEPALEVASDPTPDPGRGELEEPDPVAEAPEPEPDPKPEPTPALAPTPARDIAPKWALERIGEETNKRQAAEERARSFEEIVNRLQSQQPKPQGDQQQPQERQPVRHQEQPREEQSAVQQEAARLLFQRDLQNVSEAGIKAYGPSWAEAVNLLTRCNANTPEFVASVMEIDPARTHEIMFEIAKDPERAVSLARMTPVRRAAEITRMSMPKTDAKPAVDPKPEPEVKTPVSKAPAPKPAIAPRASAPEIDPTTPEGDEKMDDKAWERWFKEKHYKKTA